MHYGISVSVNKISTYDYTYEIVKEENVSGIYELAHFPKVDAKWTPCLVEEIMTCSGGEVCKKVIFKRLVNHSGKWKQIFEELRSEM
jgi:hypothetical protein